MNPARSLCPPLFEERAARRVVPLIVCCDHSGRHIPATLADLGLDAAALDLHIAWDIGARQVATRLAQAFGAPLLLANYSRLVIDLNRHLDDATLIPEVSDGVVIPGNAGLSQPQRQQRIEQFFTPYHRRYGALVARLRAQFAAPIILSVHSFAPAIQGVARPWEFGVLWDQHRALAQSLLANLRVHADLCIGENQPYHARDPMGYAMAMHAQSRDVEMALIEIRQDLLGDEAGQRWAAEILYAAVAPLLNYAPKPPPDKGD